MRRIRLKKITNTKSPNKRLIFLTFILTVIGLVAVADASAPSALSNFSDKYFFVRQQILWAMVGIVGFVIASKIPYQIWSKMAVYIFALNIIGLLLVFIPALGPNLLGARRWIAVGGFSLQPAEFMKLSLAIYLAKVADSNKPLLSYIIPFGLVGILVMLEPDLGTTISLSVIAFTQMYLAGINMVHFTGLSIAGVISAMTLILTSGYRRERLMTFLEQTQDPLGKGYHIRQVLLALGSGGFWGVGLGQSRQKYSFIPEAATDSIFAVIAEEIGFVGALVLISLFVAFIFEGLRIVRNAPDTFSQILAVGLVAWIGGQSLVNISAMVALVPLTGIPLPFISYGGSSLSTVLVAAGILVNISTYSPKHEYKKRS